MAINDDRARPNPIPDLLYDWITVLQSKAEGLNAYEKYIRDAEQAGSDECLQLFRRLHEQDARMVEEIRDHLTHMMASDAQETARSAS